MILHEAGAGDFLTMTAAIREIRRVYSTAYIILVVEKCAESLAECCPYVDEVIAESFMLGKEAFQSVPDSLPKLFAILPVFSNVARKLLRHRIDIAFVTTKGNAPTTPLLAYMSGAKDLISHSFGAWTPLLTVKAVRIYGSHTADITLGYLEQLIRTPVTDRRLEAWFTPLDIGNVRALMPTSKKIYAVCLGGKLIAHYPPELYAELINLIMREDNEVRFAIIGGSTDVDAAKILMARVDLSPGTVLYHWYPYGVPSVVVHPAHALPECKGSKAYFGCAANHPHCITQITPTDLFKAFKTLQTQTAKHATEPIFLSSKQE